MCDIMSENYRKKKRKKKKNTKKGRGKAEKMK